MLATSQSDQNQERQSYRLRWLGADLPPSVLEGGTREAGGPGPPRVIPRRDVANKPQLHPVGSFAERHPANSPHGDFSLQIPKATKTPATRFCPEKGGVLRTSCQNDQFIRKKAGFYGQTRGRVSRTDADCGLTDKRGLRFTDRRSSDFPDTRYLNFPEASQLTKQPKSGITNSAQKTSAQKNGVIYRQVGGSLSKTC